MDIILIFTRVKSDGIKDLASCDFQLDCVVDLDHWVWVTEGFAVVRHQEGNAFWSSLNTLYFAQLVLLN